MSLNARPTATEASPAAPSAFAGVSPGKMIIAAIRMPTIQISTLPKVTINSFIDRRSELCASVRRDTFTKIQTASHVSSNATSPATRFGSCAIRALSCSCSDSRRIESAFWNDIMFPVLKLTADQRSREPGIRVEAAMHQTAVNFPRIREAAPTRCVLQRQEVNCAIRSRGSARLGQRQAATSHLAWRLLYTKPWRLKQSPSEYPGHHAASPWKSRSAAGCRSRSASGSRSARTTSRSSRPEWRSIFS